MGAERVGAERMGGGKSGGGMGREAVFYRQTAPDLNFGIF